MAATGDFYRHVLDVRLGDIDFLWGKLKLVLIGSYKQGGNFDIAFAQWHDRRRSRRQFGRRWRWIRPAVGPSSERGASLATFKSPLSMVGDSSISTQAVSTWVSSAALTILRSLRMVSRTLRLVHDGPFRSVDPYNNSQRARANVFWVWNPTDNFSMGTWATYQFNDQGFTSYQVNSNGSISSASRYDASLYCGHKACTIGFGVRLRFKVHSVTRISRTIECDRGSVWRWRFAGYLHDRPDHQAERGLFHPSRAARLRDLRRVV